MESNHWFINLDPIFNQVTTQSLWTFNPLCAVSVENSSTYMALLWKLKDNKAMKMSFKYVRSGQFCSVQSLVRVWLFATTWTAVCQSSLSITNSRSLQTHVHWVGEAIQASHPLSSPSPPAFDFSQHQSLFKWVSSLHQMAKVLEFQLQHQSFQWTFRTDFLSDGLIGSPCSPRDSQRSSPTPQFKSINSLALSHIHTWLLEKP